MSGPAPVQARGVRFAYASHMVLDGIDLEIGEGEVFGVVGADGAGKSTLLMALIGQLVIDAGAISILGRPPGDPSLRPHVAYMPQTFGQYLDLTVDENLRFFAELHGLDRASASRMIDDLLRRTGLAAFRDRRAGQLSGGMMQKLALACALVTRPRAMFLDEPTTGVDPVSRRGFWQLLEEVRADGVAIVYATANLDEAERCDRVGMLEGGRFSRIGDPLDLIRAIDAPLLQVTGPGARSARGLVRGFPGVALAYPVGQALTVWLRSLDDEPAFREFVRQAPGLSAQPVAPSLHEVVMRDLALGRRYVDGRSGP